MTVTPQTGGEPAGHPVQLLPLLFTGVDVQTAFLLCFVSKLALGSVPLVTCLEASNEEANENSFLTIVWLPEATIELPVDWTCRWVTSISPRRLSSVGLPWAVWVWAPLGCESPLDSVEPLLGSMRGMSPSRGCLGQCRLLPGQCGLPPGYVEPPRAVWAPLYSAGPSWAV